MRKPLYRDAERKYIPTRGAKPGYRDVFDARDAGDLGGSGLGGVARRGRRAARPGEVGSENDGGRELDDCAGSEATKATIATKAQAEEAAGRAIDVLGESQ